jgi:hypothetical protein
VGEIPQLKYWILTQWTPILLAQIICEMLAAWTSNTGPTLKATPQFKLVKILKLQDAMGWQPSFEGAPALGWSEYMDLYYNFIRSNRNGHRWLSSIIKKLWNISWDLWEHQNGAAHGKQDGVTAAFLQQEVQNEFQKGNASLQIEVLNLKLSSKEVLAWPSHYQCSWLILIQTARAKSE